MLKNNHNLFRVRFSLLIFLLFSRKKSFWKVYGLEKSWNIWKAASSKKRLKKKIKPSDDRLELVAQKSLQLCNFLNFTTRTYPSPKVYFTNSLTSLHSITFVPHVVLVSVAFKLHFRKFLWSWATSLKVLIIYKRATHTSTYFATLSPPRNCCTIFSVLTVLRWLVYESLLNYGI